MTAKNQFAPNIATHDRQFTVNEKALQKQLASSIISGVIGAGVSYVIFNQTHK